MYIIYIRNIRLVYDKFIFWSDFMNNNKNNKRNPLENLALISQVGLSIITPILLGVYLGIFIDKKAGRNGVFTIIFIIIGAGAGFMNLIKLAGPRDKGK